MYIIKGFKKNSGTLKNGKPWDNYTLFCLKEENGVTRICRAGCESSYKDIAGHFPRQFRTYRHCNQSQL